MPTCREIELLRDFKEKHKEFSYEKIGQAIGVHQQTVMKWLLEDVEPNTLSKKAIREFLMSQNFRL